VPSAINLKAIAKVKKPNNLSAISMPVLPKFLLSTGQKA
jgi:hypothetical protein